MTREESIKLTVKSLLEVVQTGAKNIEITIMDGFGKVSVCHPFPNLDIYYMHTLSELGSSTNRDYCFGD